MTQATQGRSNLNIQGRVPALSETTASDEGREDRTEQAAGKTFLKSYCHGGLCEYPISRDSGRTQESRNMYEAYK